MKSAVVPAPRDHTGSIDAKNRRQRCICRVPDQARCAAAAGGDRARGDRRGARARLIVDGPARPGGARDCVHSHRAFERAVEVGFSVPAHAL